MRIHRIIASLFIAVVTALFLLTSSAQPRSVQANPAACPPGCTIFLPMVSKVIPLDLQIGSVEFTQAVQSLANDVPLVANRPTFARLTVSVSGASTPVNGVTAQLHAFRGSVELGSSPINPTVGSFAAPLSPNRGSLNDTLNFWLPSDWTSSPADVYAQLNPTQSVTENNYTNNRYPASGFTTLNFRNTPAMTIVVVPLQTTVAGVVRTPTVPSNLTSFLYQTYPLAQTPTIISHAVANGGAYATSTDMWNSILNTLTSIHTAEDSTTPYKEYFGVVNVDCSGGCISGIGWIGSSPSSVFTASAVGFDGAGFGGNAAGQTAAHEIGHNNGRRHAYCGASGNYYPPNSTGKLDDWGFNIVTQALYNPATTYDFMSYCSTVWTSKWGFQSIYNFRGATLAATAAQPAQDALLLSGSVSGSQVSMSPPFKTAAPLTPDDPRGEYRLEVRDGADQLLRSLQFNPVETDLSTRGFQLAIPADDRARRLAIFRGSRLAFEQRASSDLRVSINTNPLAQTDPTELSWTANGALSYMARVSQDGGASWQAFGLNLKDNLIKLDSQLLPGGDLLVEVQASDGVRVVTHQTRMRIGKHAPQARIVREDLQNLTAGQPIVLTGITHDAEDGALSGNAVRWSSDRDGALGSGSNLWLEHGLSAGTHTLTLTATDSDGNSSSDQIVVGVR